MIKLVQDKRDNTRSQACHYWMVRLHAEEKPLPERNHNKAASGLHAGNPAAAPDKK